jgi:hypothetical protein
MNWPPEPHLPGITPRPAEDHFDAVKATLEGCETPDALAASACFKAGFEAFERRYYWEAHELWEPVWMQLPEGSREKALVQGLIQLANAALKQRMGRPKAAERILLLADTALDVGDSLMGVSPEHLRGMRDIAMQEVQYSAITDLT